MTVRFVTPEKFDEIIAKNDKAARLWKKSRNANLSLAEKVALQREAKAIERELSEMTRPPADYDGPITIE